MGNRAVITTAPYSDDNLGIYLHWNGGRDSVEAFLSAAKTLGYRDPASDPAYGMARLTALICTFMGLADSTSVGIGLNKELDTSNGDNGVYVIGPDWSIVDRLHYSGEEQSGHGDFSEKLVAKVKAAHSAAKQITA